MNILRFALLMSLVSCTSSLPVENQFVVVVGQHQKVFNGSDEGTFREMIKVQRVDPNSGDTLTYLGLTLENFLKTVLRQDMDINSIASIEAHAKDGYLIQLSKNIIKDKDSFVAFEVSGVPEEGLYNKLLQTYFDWKPLYILLSESGQKSLSSPYQVEKIVVHFEDKNQPSMVENESSKGEQLFMSSCMKCHSLNSKGGRKAPPIQAVLPRYSNSMDLKTFLRNPREVSQRNIEMSPFTGSDQELEELVRYLKAL